MLGALGEASETDLLEVTDVLRGRKRLSVPLAHENPACREHEDG